MRGTDIGIPYKTFQHQWESTFLAKTVFPLRWQEQLFNLSQACDTLNLIVHIISSLALTCWIFTQSNQCLNNHSHDSDGFVVIKGPTTDLRTANKTSRVLMFIFQLSQWSAFKCYLCLSDKYIIGDSNEKIFFLVCSNHMLFFGFGQLGEKGMNPR